MQRTNSLEKTMMLRKIEGRRRRGHPVEESFHLGDSHRMRLDL